MNFNFTFKHMEVSPALEEYTTHRLDEKISRLITKPISTHIIFTVEGSDHVAHAQIHGGDGFDIDAKGHSPDMYASVDMLADRLMTQIKKHKEKLKEHRGMDNESKLIEAEITREKVLNAVAEDEEE